MYDVASYFNSNILYITVVCSIEYRDVILKDYMYNNVRAFKSRYHCHLYYLRSCDNIKPSTRFLKSLCIYRDRNDITIILDNICYMDQCSFNILFNWIIEDDSSEYIKRIMRAACRESEMARKLLPHCNTLRKLVSNSMIQELCMCDRYCGKYNTDYVTLLLHLGIDLTYSNIMYFKCNRRVIDNIAYCCLVCNSLDAIELLFKNGYNRVPLHVSVEYNHTYKSIRSFVTLCHKYNVNITNCACTDIHMIHSFIGYTDDIAVFDDLISHDIEKFTQIDCYIKMVINALLCNNTNLLRHYVKKYNIDTNRYTLVDGTVY